MLNVRVSLDELCQAYEMNNEEISHYPDVNNGKLLMRMDPLLTGYKDEELEEELEDEDRYLELPTISSRAAYGLMVDFVETVTSTELQDRLNTALNGRKPFRTFKDVLFDFPEELENWFKFEREAHRNEMLKWLREQNIALEQDKIQVGTCTCSVALAPLCASRVRARCPYNLLNEIVIIDAIGNIMTPCVRTVAR